MIKVKAHLCRKARRHMYSPSGVHVNEEAAQRQDAWVRRGRIKISAHLRGRRHTAGFSEDG